MPQMPDPPHTMNPWPALANPPILTDRQLEVIRGVAQFPGPRCQVIDHNGACQALDVDNLWGFKVGDGWFLVCGDHAAPVQVALAHDAQRHGRHLRASDVVTHSSMLRPWPWSAAALVVVWPELPTLALPAESLPSLAPWEQIPLEVDPSLGILQAIATYAEHRQKRTAEFRAARSSVPFAELNGHHAGLQGVLDLGAGGVIVRVRRLLFDQIRRECTDCAADLEVSRDDDGRWWHPNPDHLDDPTAEEFLECDAAALRDVLREFDPAPATTP